MLIQKNGRGLSLVLDIRSSSVGGSLVLFDKSEKLSGNQKNKKNSLPKILASLRIAIPGIDHENISAGALLRGVLRALEDICQKLQKIRVGKISSIDVFLASPWSHTETRVVKYAKKNPFVVSEQMIMDFVHKESAKMTGSSKGNSLRSIKSSIAEIKLNGYPLNSPFGKRAFNCEISFLGSMAQEKFLKQIESTIRRYLGGQIYFNSFLDSVFFLSRSLISPHENFVLLDIAGEITDLCLVKNSVPVHFSSFPYGKNSIIRDLAKMIKKSYSETETIFKLYLNKKLEKGLMHELFKYLDLYQKAWIKKIDQSLYDLARHHIALPPTFILTADEPFAEWFKESVKKCDWGQFGLTCQRFNVIIISDQNFAGLYEIAQNVPRDLFLLIETMYQIL